MKDKELWTRLLRDGNTLNAIKESCRIYKGSLDVEVLRDAENQLKEMQGFYFWCRAKALLVEQLACEMNNEFFSKQQKADFVNLQEEANIYVKEIERVLEPYVRAPYIHKLTKAEELKEVRTCLKEYLQYAEKIDCIGKNFQEELNLIKKDYLTESDEDKISDEIIESKLNDIRQVLRTHLDASHSLLDELQSYSDNDIAKKYLNQRKELEKHVAGRVRDMTSLGYSDQDVEMSDLKQEFIENINKRTYKSKGYIVTPIDKISLAIDVFKRVAIIQKDRKLKAEKNFIDF